MSKKIKIEKLPDTEVPQFELSVKQKKELDDAWDEVMGEAKKVVDDYANNPSELSGSAIQIHEDSPFLDENLTSHNWNKVVRGNVLDEIITNASDIITFGPKKSKKDVVKKKKN